VRASESRNRQKESEKGGRASESERASERERQREKWERILFINISLSTSLYQRETLYQPQLGAEIREGFKARGNEAIALKSDGQILSLYPDP
jgi:hypothetical protein